MATWGYYCTPSLRDHREECVLAIDNQPQISRELSRLSSWCGVFYHGHLSGSKTNDHYQEICHAYRRVEFFITVIYGDRKPTNAVA